MNNERKNNREIVPYKVDRIPDADLAEGEEMILIHGQEGIRVWGDNGEIVNETEPRTQVISYGPRNRVVPPDEIRTANRDLDEGIENVIQEGFSGLQMVDENGEIVKEYPSGALEIEYGPVREHISFDSVRKPNNELKEGKENVLVSGKRGLQLVDEEGNVEVVNEPRTEEIEYGPKRIALSFNTRRESNRELPEGETQVVTAGVYGQQLEDEEGNITPVSEPVTEVIEYGPIRHYLSFETQRVANPDLDEGIEKVTTAGREGLQLEDEEGNITAVSDPVTEVIDYGPIRHSIPFETERVSNPELDEGVENVTTAGREGLQLEDEERNITLVSKPITKVIEYGPIRHYIPFEIDRVSNPDLPEKEENVTTAGEEGLKLEDEEGNMTSVSNPVTKVIEYGPIRVSIPYETSRVSSFLLAEGKENRTTEGKEGLEYEDEQGERTTAYEPVTEVIEYGPVRHYIPFDEERIVNSELAEGKETVITPGKAGIQLEDEEGNVTLVSDPETQVVEYGPARISLPYVTVRTVNTNLAQGEEQIVIRGREGLRLKDEEGNIEDKYFPRAQEIEYGPQSRVAVYKTNYYPYLNLEEGETLVLFRGIDGLELVDEKGKVVERFAPVSEEIAYGPDENEREKLKKSNAN